MPVRLRYLAHDLEVPPGEFLIGRSPDCQLSLDDPLVSRRHAILVVHPDAVFIEDLASRNGILVNGKRIQSPTRVSDGDQITVGSQVMTLVGVPGSEPGHREANTTAPNRRATHGPEVITLSGIDNEELAASTAESQAHPPPVESPDKRVSSLALIGGLAEKALAMGRAEEAERILQAVLHDIGQRAKEAKPVEPGVSEQAARYAVRIGGATGKAPWIDYVFDLYAGLSRPLPASIVDELYTVVRKVKSLEPKSLRAYLAVLRDAQGSFGPAERFAVQRLEGLERLIAAK